MNLKQIMVGFTAGFLCALLVWIPGGGDVVATTHELARPDSTQRTRLITSNRETAQAGVKCSGDLNGDRVVDGLDLLALLVNWGPCPAGCDDDDFACDPGETCCGGTCVDLDSDPANCGTCDFVCGVDEDCIDGQCFPETCAKDGDCPDGYYCGGLSVCELKLPKGAACSSDNQCHDGLVCHDGFCTLPTTWYRDDDEDGWGDCDDFIVSVDPATPYTVTICGDCDDADSTVYPGAVEYCNGVDNDCDGTIDNDPADTGGSCDTGMEGQCAAGTFECIDGALECVPIVGPTQEVCDGIDNDCNGVVDDIPNEGMPCDTGLPGQCADGVIVCEFGVLLCVPINDPIPEICDDGIDNSCNGAIDCDDPACDGHPDCP